MVDGVGSRLTAYRFWCLDLVQAGINALGPALDHGYLLDCRWTFQPGTGLCRQAKKSCPWLVFAGALSVFGGLLIFGNPLISAVVGGVFLAYLIGVTIIVSGLMLVFVGGSKNRQKKKRGLSSTLLGALYVLFGLLVVTHPVLTVSSMAWVFGTWALFSGVVAVVLALRLRLRQREA